MLYYKTKSSSDLTRVYITGLSTERKERPSFVSSLVKLIHGSGTASSLRAMVLNLHVLRWSAMLEMLANFHVFTVSNAVLNRHTLSCICQDVVPSSRFVFSQSRTTMPRDRRRLAHTSLIVSDTLESWHRLKPSKKLAMCWSNSKGRSLRWS